MRTHALLLTLRIVGALLIIPGTLARAEASDASFGDTVTTDVKLSDDISGSGTGLIIGANGITVDLNGHTISSTDGTALGIDNSSSWAWSVWT